MILSLVAPTNAEQQALSDSLVSQGFTHISHRTYEFLLPNGWYVAVAMYEGKGRVLAYAPQGQKKPRKLAPGTWHSLDAIPSLLQQLMSDVSILPSGEPRAIA